MFSSKHALIVNVPFIVLFGLHFIAILPDLFIRFLRKIEALIVTGLATEFILEILRESELKKSGVLTPTVNFKYATIDLTLRITVWILIYTLYFFPWPKQNM